MDEAEVAADESSDLGIIRLLGDLPPDAIISEAAMAKMFNRHRVSIKRAVDRGELPPPIRLFGGLVWTVMALREHMAERLEKAKREADQMQRRTSQLGT